ncbi:marine proteobacterial sortase target protein [Novosphingobium sp. JCM 18896]|uniref:marine proteobacterial sortase target protein n=1 Tax=Novosphingobium sp. JCM 18896 TaxID=2989731 RepID=UPI0022222730|nr:marine proteobacterial sortase target protein [Novosphingobium sp. JCM 18896]MCW1430748.1 marine proteobacterial sortase target protein [Novosphingobium sp. JCM 18896]
MLIHPPLRPAFRKEARKRLSVGTITLVAVVVSCLAASQARAQDAKDPAVGGALMLQGKGVATTMPAVRLGTDMDVTVSGQILRVRVTQAFRNTSDKWMEATYLYPLPDDGAVDTLKMVVGQRVILGKIKRRQEAREIYDQAKAEGRKAGLVESDRPNLFRNSVANIGPGETVLISIEYQAPVRQLGGEFAMRLPLVVGPRYVPPHTLTDGAALADATRVIAPLADPALASVLGRSLNPVSITVHLAPGFVPANVISPYHKIAVVDAGPAERTVTLAAGEEPADRDFELRWRSASADPTIGLFRQALAGQQYVMATITPQAKVEAGKLAPREMIFVIDNSGSMGGESMAAAKASLLHALSTLRPEDRFNVIRFDDTMTQLFDHVTPASAEQVALARRFTEGLDAAGGTEMLPALKAALVDDNPDDPGLRQVVFLTDGDLSNEKEMMAEIAAHADRSRVFMVGIGSAPNNFLMRRMAETGRGTYTNIGDGGEVMAKMTALLNRLTAPAVRELAARVEGSALSLTPARLPDLYAGEPLVLLGKGDRIEGKLVVSGKIGDKPWSQTVDLDRATDSPSVARLWANRRIGDVEAQRWSGQIESEAADDAIAELGLTYNIVTTQTSLVAVDETPARPEGARLTREDLPLLLPKGWDFDRLLGKDAPAPAASAPPPEQEQQMDLPQTATGFLGAIYRGLALLGLGLAGLAASRRRRAAEPRS